MNYSNDHLKNIKGGTTPLINPGTVGGVGNDPATYIMLDLETMEVDIHEIPKSIERISEDPYSRAPATDAG